MPPCPATARIHVAFAAGSGITPVLSILRGVLAREPNSRFFLFYGNRTSADVLFLEELEELKDRHLGRLSLFHVLSREEQDIPVAARPPRRRQGAPPPVEPRAGGGDRTTPSCAARPA